MITEINNLKIHYIKKGKGKNVLIIPGWGATINTYLTLINDVSKYATVYCLDMPGTGMSEEPKESFRIEDYVDLIKEFITNKKIKNIDLIGHSNGGRIIIKLLNEDNLKFKIGKVILIASAGIVRKKSKKKKIKIKIYKTIKKIFPKIAVKIGSLLGSKDYKNATPVMRKTMSNLINTDLTKCLTNIKNKTLLIWGEKDSETILEDAKLMNKLIENSELIVFSDCTHFVFIEKKNEVNKKIENFLKGD